MIATAIGDDACDNRARNSACHPEAPFRAFRVLHATESAIGGISSYIDDLACLQQQAYGSGSIRVVLPESHACHLSKVDADSVRAFPERGNRILNSLALVDTVLSQIRSFRPDVVHLHSTYAGFTLRPFLKLLRGGQKVIYSPHGWAFMRDVSLFLKRILEKVELVLAGTSDVVVCTSNGEYDSAMGIGIGRQRLALILNGIPSLDGRVTETVTWPDNRLKLLFVGRFDRQKGIDLFLGAMRQLQDEAFGYVIGAPVVDSEPLGDIPDNVELVGWQSRERLLAYYHSADLLVMPSRWEGFGLVAAEAMRSGLAVLGTRIGGLSDTVDDSVTGMLVEPNSVPAIVDAVRSLERDDLLRMGEAGRLRFQRMFSSDRMFSDMNELYGRLVRA